jgi:recombination protein RecA
MAKGKSNHIEGEVTKVEKVERSELAELVHKALNKASADGSKVAYFLDEEEDPSMVTDWISTGSTLLDLAISNRKHGGLPVGRIVELSSQEAAGKSLICAHILAETQKMGGYGVLIDTENAAAPEFWKSIGLNIRNLGYVPLYTVESIFAKIEEVIGIVRKHDKKQLVTIVVDSLSQASSEVEMESEHGKDGYNTSKSIIISKACRKITGLIGQQRILVVFVNQLRMNLAAVGHQDKWIVPGGKAMAFAASVRLRLSNMGKLKGAGQKIIGNKCKVVVTKNRMGPPHRAGLFEIHYDSGIQDLTSWLDFLKDNGFARKDGDKYAIKLPSGTVKLTTREFLEKIHAEQTFKDEVYDVIATDYIMKYRPANSQILEGLEVEESSVDEE